jgi:hypothetical protein
MDQPTYALKHPQIHDAAEAACKAEGFEYGIANHSMRNDQGLELGWVLNLRYNSAVEGLCPGVVLIDEDGTVRVYPCWNRGSDRRREAISRIATALGVEMEEDYPPRGTPGPIQMAFV